MVHANHIISLKKVIFIFYFGHLMEAMVKSNDQLNIPQFISCY